MIPNRPYRPLVSSRARVLLAALVLAGLASSAAPLRTKASGTRCTLSCCAGRAPHGAGSCMSGACQAVLHHSQGRSHIHFPAKEQFCGFERFATATRTRVLRSNVGSVVRSNDQQQDSAPIMARGASLAKPCDSNCGWLVTISNAQGRSYESAAPLFANRLCHPLRSLNCLNFSSACGHDGFRIAHAPRGPPAISS